MKDLEVLVKDFLEQLRSAPQTVEFSDTMAVIDGAYHFKPTAFRNGAQVNEAGENNGSCKILYFGQLHDLSEQEVLSCFGRYYREDVLKNPSGEDHQNIRNFMKTGWAGVEFQGVALKERERC